jgi:hypothetical protein
MPGCGDELYRPGHNLHWIQTKKAGSDPLAWFPATVIDVDGEIATVRYDDDDSTCRLWRHGGYAGRLRTGDRVSVCERWHVLQLPGTGGGTWAAAVPRGPRRHEHWRGAPLMSVFDTYLTNTLRIPTDDDRWVELRPAAAHNAPPQPVHVLPAWNPYGAATSLGRNIALREQLEVTLLGAAGSFRLAAVIAADRTWADEALVVSGADQLVLARIAATHGQWIFWRWDAHGLHLVEWGWGATLAAVPVAAVYLDRRPCPVRAPGADDGQPCTSPPVTRSDSGSGTAFNRRRSTLICVAGCDTCHGGRLLDWPRGFDHSGWSVPGRHRPPATPI